MQNNTQTYSLLPKMMINFFDRCSDPICIASPDSKILYVNMASVRLANLKTPDEMKDRAYEEVKSPLFEDEQTINHWKDQDQQIFNNQDKELKMLEIHPGRALYPYTVTKNSIYNETNEYIGTIHHIKYLEIYRPNDFIKGKLPGSLLLNKPDELFTEKECEVIFLQLQRMTSKMIAKVLFLSPRTIENKIQEMYEKAGVNNGTDFAEFCEKRNLHRYLPRRFIDAERCSFEQSIDVGSHIIDE